MPGEDVYSWSTTAASNDTADTAINWREGQPRASVNDSSRSVLAAIAKFRDLLKGSIVTGGTANAQTFTSGVGYTVIPAGFRVTLKIGAGLTNTAATTLSMDGIASSPIVDRLGAAISGGELIEGSYAEFLYDGSNWILLTDAATTWGSPGHGRFDYVSPTACRFVPYGGKAIKINGRIHGIPAAGIAGLNNTNITIDGVPFQNLVGNSTYLVFATLQSGVITGDFRNMPQHGHITSTAPGNLGVEVMVVTAGSVETNTHTLIGMVHTTGAGQFKNDTATRLVISWFNRRPISMLGTNTNGQPVTSHTLTELNSFCRCEFVMWAEAMQVAMSGQAFADVAAAEITFGVGLDSPTGSFIAQKANVFTVNAQVPCGVALNVDANEGYHFATPLGAVNTGTATFSVLATAITRG